MAVWKDSFRKYLVHECGYAIPILEWIFREDDVCPLCGGDAPSLREKVLWYDHWAIITLQATKDNTGRGLSRPEVTELRDRDGVLTRYGQ